MGYTTRGRKQQQSSNAVGMAHPADAHWAELEVCHRLGDVLPGGLHRERNRGEAGDVLHAGSGLKLRRVC